MNTPLVSALVLSALVGCVRGSEVTAPDVTYPLSFLIVSSSLEDRPIDIVGPLPMEDDLAAYAVSGDERIWLLGFTEEQLQELHPRAEIDPHRLFEQTVLHAEREACVAGRMEDYFEIELNISAFDLHRLELGGNFSLLAENDEDRDDIRDFSLTLPLRFCQSDRPPTAFGASEHYIEEWTWIDGKRREYEKDSCYLDILDVAIMDEDRWLVLTSQMLYVAERGRRFDENTLHLVGKRDLGDTVDFEKMHVEPDGDDRIVWVANHNYQGIARLRVGTSTIVLEGFSGLYPVRNVIVDHERQLVAVGEDGLVVHGPDLHNLHESRVAPGSTSELRDITITGDPAVPLAISSRDGNVYTNDGRSGADWHFRHSQPAPSSSIHLGTIDALTSSGSFQLWTASSDGGLFRSNNGISWDAVPLNWPSCGLEDECAYQKRRQKIHDLIVRDTSPHGLHLLLLSDRCSTAHTYYPSLDCVMELTPGGHPADRNYFVAAHEKDGKLAMAGDDAHLVEYVLDP